MFSGDSEGILSTVLYGPDQRTRLLPETGSVLSTTYAPIGISDRERERHLCGIEALVRAEAPLGTTELIDAGEPETRLMARRQSRSACHRPDS